MNKMTIQRRNCGKLDVQIKILYSGICHSDLHSARAEWECPNLYPMIPGHEGAGEVVAVGSDVTKFKPGDRVGVGVMVGSCRECEQCNAGFQNYCEKGFDGTYNCLKTGKDCLTKNCERGELLHGTYTNLMTVREDFVFKVCDSMPLDRVGPLLCAGITTYDPLVHFGAKKGGENFTVGVLGFGGLGHMALKFAKSFGNDTYAISGSVHKRPWAEKLEVKFVLHSDKAEWKKAPKFDLIIDTVSAQHDVNKYLKQLKRDGTLCLVGLPSQPLGVKPFCLVMGRKSFSGSCIGGCPATQEMLDYCAEHKVYPEVHVIHPKEVNDAHATLAKNSAPSARFVIDCTKLNEDFDTTKPEIDFHEWEVHPGGSVWPEKANWHAQNPPAKEEEVEAAP